MDITHIDRLREEQQKGINSCNDKISQWDRFLEEYERLKQRLITFPDALSYDVTVPFGSQAFAMGKIVHTNEVTVLLGDDWFAKVSTKQAVGIVERRIHQCVDMKEKLCKEKDHLNNWTKYIDDISDNQDLVEIIEEYEEEQEKKWRLQHALNVREYHQKERRERSNSGGSNCSTGSSEELQRSEGSEGSSDGEEEGAPPPSNLQLDCNKANDRAEPSKEGVEEECGSSPDVGGDSGSSPEVGGDCGSSPEAGGVYGSSLDSQDGKRHVRWMDLSKQKVKRITFKHTKEHTKNRHYHNIPVNGDDEDHRQKLQSPSDIYRQFGAFLQSSPPKSILKVKHSPSSESDEPFRFEPQQNQEEEENDARQAAFTGEVRETSSPIRIEQRRQRPASHFKNSRKGHKKK